MHNDCGHEAAIVLGPECPDRDRSPRAPLCCANKRRNLHQKQHTHVRTMNSGAGSTGWLEKEAAEIRNAHPAIWAQGMCAPAKTNPPTHDL